MSEFERLFERSPDPRVRDALRSAVELEPPPGAEGAVWNALGAKLGPGATSASSAGTSAAAAAPSAVPAIALKATLAILAVGAAVGGMYAALERGREPAAPAAHSVPAGPSAGARTSAPEPSASPALPLAPPPNTVRHTEQPGTGVPSAIRRSAPAAGDTASSGSTPSSPSNRPDAPRAPSESELILAARKAVREGRYHEALSVLAQAGRDFPNGGLAQERDALEIEALSGSGAAERARVRAKMFLNRYPSSPYTRNVERALR